MKFFVKWFDQLYLIEWYQERFRAHNKKVVELEKRISLMDIEIKVLTEHLFKLQDRCVKSGIDPNPDHEDIVYLGGPDPKKHKQMPYLGDVKLAEGAGHD